MVRMDEEQSSSSESSEGIAALAVLVEDENTGKKRIIYDGSHDILVNHRIRCLDKLRMPGGREKRYVLKKFKKKGDVVFSFIGDFGKAHRRFKYVREECGFLAFGDMSTHVAEALLRQFTARGHINHGYILRR